MIGVIFNAIRVASGRQTEYFVLPGRYSLAGEVAGSGGLFILSLETIPVVRIDGQTIFGIDDDDDSTDSTPRAISPSSGSIQHLYFYHSCFVATCGIKHIMCWYRGRNS